MENILYIILVVGIILFINKIRVEMKKQDKIEAIEIEIEITEDKIEVRKLMDKIENIENKLNKSKNYTDKIEFANDIIGYLENIKTMPNYLKILTDENIDEEMEKMEKEKKYWSATIKVTEVYDCLAKADKYKFKNNLKSAKSSLMDAVYIITRKNVTDDDFILADMVPVGYDDVVFYKDIQKELKIIESKI